MLSWRPPPGSTKRCCKPSPQCLTSSLLGRFCCIVRLRANCQLRVLRPDVVLSFARAHDASVWQCLCAVLRIPDTSCDTLPMIHQRHPGVATRIVHALAQEVDSPVLGAVRRAAQELEGVSGFVVPSWPALTAGLRPPPREPEFHEPGGPRARWQHEAASRAERQFRTTSVLQQLSPSKRAMLRSQSGPAAGVAFSALPSSSLTRFQPALFRVLLQRRLALPLPLNLCSCLCGRPLDAFGHHRAACSKSGVLCRRGFAVESAAARVCREAGARVATNLFVRDMDLGVPNGGDNRRLEVVADGLPLFGGVQLAIDTTLVSAVQGDGDPPGERLTEMVWLSGALADARSKRTPNLSSQGAVPG